MAIIDNFLKEIHRLLKTQNSVELANYLRVEPEGLSDVFKALCQELKASYHNDKGIERKVESHIPQDDDDEGGVSASFHAFIQNWLRYWRDVDFSDLVETHSQLTQLTNTCIQAFSHNRGLVCLNTTIRICDALAKLAITLDKRPDLTVNLRKETSGEDAPKSLVESTAEIIQKAFTVCLNARGPSPDGIKDGKPEGKKVGIYSFANLVLKLLFQSRNTKLAKQLFTNIIQNSPPLRVYSNRQRVTYLYYLGRFHFSNNHFFYAQSCLQAAYDQCHSQFLSQRRLILIYLISSNIIMGRFPSHILMMLPEATGLSEKFDPILHAIQKGNLIAFRHALGPEHGNEQWFFRKGLLLALTSRCEVLVWRSLARRTFMLTYNFPWDPVNGEKFPTMDLKYLVTAAQYNQKILEGWRKAPANPLFVTSPDLIPPPHGVKKLHAQRGVIFMNKMPKMIDIQAIVASLKQQRLMLGWIDNEKEKFYIQGSKRAGGPLNAGFPPVWKTLKERVRGETEVPGWVQRQQKKGGTVVNLSGARPVGS